MRASASPVRPARAIGLTLLVFATFGSALWLYTWSNEFPVHYHYDEPQKTEQILDGWRNFRHPLLMLTATDGAATLLSRKQTRQQVAVVGRWVSAAFAATAVAAAVLIAARTAGLLAGLCAAVLVLPIPRLFVAAHAMKEDPALLFGLALAFLALSLYCERPSVRRMAGLGACCALAVSGKYMGVVMLPVALGIAWRVPVPGRSRRATLAWLGVGFVSVWLFVNHPALVKPGSQWKGLRKEVQHSVTEHKGFTRSVPHLGYAGLVRDETRPLLWLLVGFEVAYVVARFRSLPVPERLLAAFPLAYAGVLSFSPLVAPRYFLPVLFFAHLLAALALVRLVDLVRFLRSRGGRAARATTLLGALAASTVAIHLPPSPLFAAFERDNRALLEQWIRSELPPDAVLAQDMYVGLHDPESPRHTADYRSIPQRVMTGERRVIALGSIDEIRARGVTHVVIVPSHYRPPANPRLELVQEDRARIERGYAFYARLRAEGERVFALSPGPTWTQPALSVYRVAPRGRRINRRKRPPGSRAGPHRRTRCRRRAADSASA